MTLPAKTLPSPRPVDQLSDTEQETFLGPDTGESIIDLDHLALVGFTGEDAGAFLQGQLTNDVESLDPGLAQLQAYCNPKGRAIALARLMRGNDGYWMLVPKDLKELLVKRLKMYVLRAKVAVQDETGHMALGIMGNVDEIPGAAGRFRVGGCVPREIVILPVAAQEDLLAREGCSRYQCDVWRWLDIRAGIPSVYAATSEAFIPQTINLDLVDGVSFKKGCFPGQEIIARIRYLGKAKQRMIIARAESSASVDPGSDVFGGSGSSQKVGRVVDSVRTGINTVELSAQVAITALGSDVMTVGTADGPVLKEMEMPYPLPD